MLPLAVVRFNNVLCSASKKKLKSNSVAFGINFQLPEFTAKLATIGNVSINASFFKKFDYSSAMVFSYPFVLFCIFAFSMY